MLRLYAVLLIALTINPAVGTAAPHYTAVDLGAMSALSINSSGQIIGLEIWNQPCYWNATGTPVIATGMLRLEAISDDGQAVGCYVAEDGSVHAAIWTPSGITDIGAPFGDSTGMSINHDGRVVGQSGGYACLWIPSEEPRRLASLAPTDTTSRAFSINAGGAVAGDSGFGTDGQACIWNPDGTITALGTLGGTTSCARSINAGGQVVGYADPSFGDNCHAFIWDSTSGMRDLGTLQDNGEPSWAFSINNAGQVAGSSGSKAFVWDQGSGLVELPTLGGDRSGANWINDAGWIVGSSSTSNGDFHAVLWRPVPEPSSAATLLVAPIWLLIVTRRRAVR